MFSLRRSGDLQYCSITPWDQAFGLLHGFTTRHGGVSPPPFHTLNLGLHVGDAPAAVMGNRRRVCDALGIDAQVLVAGEQIHGDQVALVTQRDKGRGSAAADDALPGVDGLVTAAPDVVLISFYADCTPLYFFDPAVPAVGLAHAGWKGTLAGIGVRTLEAMAEHFGTPPERCRVAIGPSIGPCCYQVGTEVADRFRTPGWIADNLDEGQSEDDIAKSGSPGEAVGPVIARQDGLYLDLWAANRQAVLAAGVRPEHVLEACWCTMCRPDLFFSHRGSGGRTGRMAAFIRPPHYPDRFGQPLQSLYSP